jgi:hypothetical protein
MESKFKVGDAVTHRFLGTGTVTGHQDGRVIVKPDDSTYNDDWLADEENLTLIDQTAYYYEEQTRNGQQWFRITANGDWMPKRETVGQKYDRAGMATAAMQGLLANPSPQIVTMSDKSFTYRAVELADALITELERTKP